MTVFAGRDSIRKKTVTPATLDFSKLFNPRDGRVDIFYSHPPD